MKMSKENRRRESIKENWNSRKSLKTTRNKIKLDIKNKNKTRYKIN